MQVVLLVMPVTKIYMYTLYNYINNEKSFNDDCPIFDKFINITKNVKKIKNLYRSKIFKIKFLFL